MAWLGFNVPSPSAVGSFLQYFLCQISCWKGPKTGVLSRGALVCLLLVAMNDFKKIAKSCLCFGARGPNKHGCSSVGAATMRRQLAGVRPLSCVEKHSSPARR